MCSLLFDSRFTIHVLKVITSSIKSSLAVATVIVLLTSCGLLSRSVKPGEEFVMKPNDKVIVSGTGLEIKLEAVGHQSASNAQSRPISSFFVKLAVTSGGQTRSMEVEDSVDVGDYTIVVKSANPFRSDGGPKCSLLVTRR